MSHYFTYTSKGISGVPIKSTIHFEEVAAIITERDIVKVVFNSGTVIDINFKDDLNLNHKLIEAYNNYQEGYQTEEEMNMEMDRVMSMSYNNEYIKQLEKELQKYRNNVNFIIKLKRYFRKLFKGE